MSLLKGSHHSLRATGAAKAPQGSQQQRFEPGASDPGLAVLGRGSQAYEQFTALLRRLHEVNHPALILPQRIALTDEGQVRSIAPQPFGTSLHTVVKERVGVSAGELTTLAMNLASLLESLLKSRLWLGHLCPENIRVYRGRAYVEHPLVGAHAALACPSFSAPELSDGDSITADIYSLGKVMEFACRKIDRDRLKPWSAPLTDVVPSMRPHPTRIVHAWAHWQAAMPIAEPVYLPAVTATPQTVAERFRLAVKQRWSRVHTGPLRRYQDGANQTLRSGAA